MSRFVNPIGDLRSSGGNEERWICDEGCQRRSVHEETSSNRRRLSKALEFPISRILAAVRQELKPLLLRLLENPEITEPKARQIS